MALTIHIHPMIGEDYFSRSSSFVNYVALLNPSLGSAQMKTVGSRRRRTLNAIAMMGGMTLTMSFVWRVSATYKRQRVVIVAKASMQELLDRPALCSFHLILRALRDTQLNLAALRLLGTPPILISTPRISIQGPSFIAALPAVDLITTLPGKSMI